MASCTMSWVSPSSRAHAGILPRAQRRSGGTDRSISSETAALSPSFTRASRSMVVSMQEPLCPSIRHKRAAREKPTRATITPGCILADTQRRHRRCTSDVELHHTMQLLVARLCLDCEEIHEPQQCPACASETFAFLTRWVPAPERRSKPRSAQPAPQPAPSRLPSRGKVVGLSMAGLGILGGGQWLAQGRSLIERAASNQHSGELK